MQPAIRLNIMDHDAITKVVTANGTIPYGVGITPNPYAAQQAEWVRRIQTAALQKHITEKIESLFEIRFITPPETSEFIEALVTMSESRQILEVGTHTGFTALHILRAIVGKPGAMLVSIDCRPAHDAAFFTSPEIAPYFRHIPEWTPGCLEKLAGQIFDLVFVDSDHSVEHTEKEMLALREITRPGSIFLFHDVPEWQTPDHRVPMPIVGWLDKMVKSGFFKGLILPTAEQLDCADIWGPGYPKQCNPHLGVFIRQ